MTIPFIKAHGAGNDFLLTWAERAPESDLATTARAICDRHTGIGGDGTRWAAAGRGVPRGPGGPPHQSGAGVKHLRSIEHK